MREPSRLGVGANRGDVALQTEPSGQTPAGATLRRMTPRLQKHRASPATAREIVASVGATREDLAAVEKALRAALSEPPRGRSVEPSETQLSRALAALEVISTPIKRARPAAPATKSRAQAAAAAKSPRKAGRKPTEKLSMRPTATAAGRRGTPGLSPRKAGRT
jgi:hypothetical protein